jgi:ubiquinone biosynthesis protein
MHLSLKPGHLKRYAEITRLLLKYSRSEVVRRAAADVDLSDDHEDLSQEPGEAEELTADLERMGPTFVKLGQLLSSRADLLPVPHLQALSRLQDEVEPVPFAQIEETVREELGVRLSKAFAELDPEPLAAASLAQVHRARLRSGREVAVKVQRPGVRRRVAEDLEVFAELAGFLDSHTELQRRYDLASLVEELRRSLTRELDYRLEAANLRRLRENLRSFERLVIPEPIDDYSTERVLVMELVRGTKIEKLSPVVRLEVPGAELARELHRAYLHQILIDGFFHADPHSGNVLLTPDHRLALLDLGMVGHLPPMLQDQLLKLLLAVADGRGEEAAWLLARIGDPLPDFDHGRFESHIAQLVAQNLQTTLDDLQVGKVMLEVSRASSELGVRVPPELTLLGKTLLNLDAIGRQLHPEFRPAEATRKDVNEMFRHRAWHSTSPNSLIATWMEGRELAAQLPRRANRILELVANNELRLRVDALDQEELLRGLQKLANRIAGGIVLAAMVVGAALMMRVRTAFTILGYPGFAMLLLLVAVAGGFWMLWEVLVRDWLERRRRARR